MEHSDYNAVRILKKPPDKINNSPENLKEPESCIPMIQAIRIPLVRGVIRWCEARRSKKGD